MRLALAVAAFVALGVPPALSQDAVTAPDPADIGDNVGRDFWCATAFGLAAYNAIQAGDAEGATTFNGNMTTLFQRVATQMQAGGYSRDEYNALTASYTALVMDPFRTVESTYSREDCDTAVAEATEANLAPVPETEAEAPEATAPAQ